MKEKIDPRVAELERELASVRAELALKDHAIACCNGSCVRALRDRAERTVEQSWAGLAPSDYDATWAATLGDMAKRRFASWLDYAQLVSWLRSTSAQTRAEVLAVVAVDLRTQLTFDLVDVKRLPRLSRMTWQLAPGQRMTAPRTSSVQVDEATAKRLESVGVQCRASTEPRIVSDDRKGRRITVHDTTWIYSGCDLQQEIWSTSTINMILDVDQELAREVANGRVVIAELTEPETRAEMKRRWLSQGYSGLPHVLPSLDGREAA